MKHRLLLPLAGTNLVLTLGVLALLLAGCSSEMARIGRKSEIVPIGKGTGDFCNYNPNDKICKRP